MKLKGEADSPILVEPSKNSTLVIEPVGVLAVAARGMEAPKFTTEPLAGCVKATAIAWGAALTWIVTVAELALAPLLLMATASRVCSPCEALAQLKE